MWHWTEITFTNIDVRLSNEISNKKITIHSLLRSTSKFNRKCTQSKIEHTIEIISSLNRIYREYNCIRICLEMTIEKNKQNLIWSAQFRCVSHKTTFNRIKFFCLTSKFNKTYPWNDKQIAGLCRNRMHTDNNFFLCFR